MISYLEEDKKFNFRVGAIIQNQDKSKILIHRLSKFDFWLLPGGRVEMGESTEDGIKRELEEELGIKVEPQKLITITENFFKLNEQLYHELGFNYLFNVDQTNPIHDIQGEFAGAEGEKYRYKWYSISDLDKINFKPHFMIEVLKNLPQEMIHIIEDETKTKERHKECDFEI